MGESKRVRGDRKHETRQAAPQRLSTIHPEQVNDSGVQSS